MIPILQAQKVLVPVCLELQQIQSQEMCEFCKKQLAWFLQTIKPPTKLLNQKLIFWLHKKKGTTVT